MTTERDMPLTLGDVMTEAPESVAPDTLLRTAAQKMRDGDVGALPVVSDGQLVGIVTDRDIVIQAVARGLDPNEEVVGPFASTDTVTGTPDMPLREAVDLMSNRQVRRLPIVQGGKLVGIVSMQDLAEAAGPLMVGTTEQAITGEGG